MELFWVEPTLAIASRPRGGDWLSDDLGDLRTSSIDVLVSCLTSAEEAELELTREATEAAAAGLRFVRIPIEDRGIPLRRAIFDEAISRLDLERRAGRRIAIHCRQGIGRSPLVAAALLVRSGASADEAWEGVERARRQPVPDTQEQRDWIRSFARTAAGQPG